MADSRHDADRPRPEPDPGDPDAPTAITPTFTRPPSGISAGPPHVDPDEPTTAAPTTSSPRTPANTAAVDPDAATGQAPVTPRTNHDAPQPSSQPQQGYPWPPNPPTPTVAPAPSRPAPTPAAAPTSNTPPPAAAAPPAPHAQQWAAGPPPPPPGWPPHPAQQFYPGHPPMPMPPTRPVWRRRPVIVAAAAAVVVALVVAVALFTGSGSEGGTAGGGDTPATAADTVTAYLQALSDGDADKALSFGKAEPSSKDFLTDDILRKQIAKQPITNIRVLDKGDENSPLRMGTVKVAADFGGKTSEADVRLTKVDDTWKLDNAFVRIALRNVSGDEGAESTLTLFGEPLKDKESVNVFPGFQQLGSTNDYLEVSQLADAAPLQALSFGGTSFLQPKFDLNDKGQQAVQSAVSDAFTACERSHALNPPGCPYKMDRPDAVEGTANWGPADISQVKMGLFLEYAMTTTVDGPVVMPVTVQTVDGGTASGKVDKVFFGTVDLTKKPPALTTK